jgi:cell division protein FtsX
VIHEKTRDIAILKAIGFREQDIRNIFLLEGLALGTVGTLEPGGGKNHEQSFASFPHTRTRAPWHKVC